VRSQAEVATRHIPGAVNIPLGALRGRLGELRRDRPLFVYCKVGFRSYLAYRLLVQSGFARAATLAGGLTTFMAVHPERAAPPEKPARAVPFTAYAEEKQAAAAAPTGKVVELDCSALQCPGPILKLRETMDRLAVGDEVLIRTADPGFLADAPAWCRQAGHQLVELKQAGALVEARIRKAGAAPAASAVAAPGGPRKKTMVVFSGELDRVMAAFIIANGAASTGSAVSMFFTFWGLNVLRREAGPVPAKSPLERMFGWMMPRGARALKLSKLNLLGAGTAMMKHVMRQKHVESLPGLIASAQKAGVKLIACTMTMDIMGIKKEELVDGIELGGVAAFLGEADQSGTTLFI